MEQEAKKGFKFKNFDKKKKRRIIIIGIVVVIVAAIVVSTIVSANTPMAVPVQEIETGDVTQTIDITGPICSNNVKTYFSTADLDISEIKVEKGDVVTAGDVLFTYDEDDMALALRSAQLRIQQANGGYSDAMETETKNEEELILAEASYEITTQQVNQQQAKVDDLKQKIKDKKNEIMKEDDSLREQLKGETDTDKIARLNQKIQNNTAKLTEDTDIVKWQEQLEKEQELLAQYKTDKAEYKADRKAGKKTIMTEGAKSELAAKTELERITDNDIIKNIKEAQGGVKSDFTGVVTDVKAVEGSKALKGTEILTVVDTSDMYVQVSLSKTDVANVAIGQKVDITYGDHSYTGTVSKINKVAEQNQSGALLVDAKISIDNPDDALIIKSEAKAKIYVKESKGTVMVSNDCINYGTEGSFVFVVKDGVVAKQFVKVGAKSDLTSEITEGLSAGDQVITGDIDYLEEGMEVTTYTE